jgi:hypothetical protein
VVTSDCRGGFDFTLLFEQTILAVLPAAIFALAAPARLVYLVLRRSDPKTRASSLRLQKSVYRLSAPSWPCSQMPSTNGLLFRRQRLPFSRPCKSPCLFSGARREV